MCRFFSLIVLLLSLSLSLPLCRHAELPEACPRNAISNLPQCIANAVFEGKDADMPEGKDFEIAIEPIRDKNGKVSIPRTIPEALKAMRQMLPRWYLNTLHRSRDGEGCNVIVNRDSYAGLVATWSWVHWKMDAKDSQLRQRFAELGVLDNPQVEQAILSGFASSCENENPGLLKQSLIAALLQSPRAEVSALRILPAIDSIVAHSAPYSA